MTSNESNDEVWYLALKKLLMVQGPGAIPSSIRIRRGQRFALDGDEPVDIEELIRLKAVKVYEDSDAEWAQGELAKAPRPQRRNRG
jgi:hypothetical protein